MNHKLTLSASSEKQLKEFKKLADQQVDQLMTPGNQAQVQNMLQSDYEPSEAVEGLAKCILGMFHFRVLSWGQFKVIIKRKETFANDLRRYDPELIDIEAQTQLNEFRGRFNLSINTIRKLPS